jgi:hypothetical protein
MRMANRYPLILDTTDGNKIKELPAGDNVTLRENSILDVQNINALGVINAPVITVNGNKIVAQNFADLTDTPNTFVGSENYFIKVNATGTGIEFRPLSDIANISVDNLTTTGNILPAVTGNNNIGSIALKYNQITALAVSANLTSYSGSIVFDATTGKVSYSALQGAPTFLSEFTDDIGFLRTADLDATLAGLFDEGEVFNTDIRGSVFGEDSTLLVDGVSSIITGNVSNSETTTTNLLSTSITSTAIVTTSLIGPVTGNLIINAGASGIINIGHDDTTSVNIKNAVIDSFDQGSGLGVAQLTASTDLIISAGNRVKVDGAVPFRLAHLSAAEILLVIALEGDVIYNTTTSRLQMYQGATWKDVNGNVDATVGTSNFNDVVIAGDLTITGTTTNVETTNTNITDNVITLNKGEAGAGVTLTTSGIEIERGTSPNRSLVWTENFGGKWIVTDDATLLANRLEANYLVGSLSVSTDDLVMTDGNVTATGTLTMGGNGLVQIVSVTTDIELLPVGKVKVDGNLEVTGTFDGDVTGSVFGDDSTVLVDSVNNKVVGDIQTSSLRTSESKIALGEGAGETNQGSSAVAIGYQAGETDQESWATAVGFVAGTNTQGEEATAFGAHSGQVGQGAGAVAIGAYAGNVGQGNKAVAIGYEAGPLNQAANSIVINATGNTLNNTQADAFIVKPIRNLASANVMMYNPANGELTHTATPGTLAADLDQTTVAIGATTATAINIGNAGSTTTINGTLSVPALVSGNITADDSMSITTASGDGNEISIVPQGTNRAVNLTADVIRISGDVILPIVAKAGVVGDIKGSVVGDDSTVLIDGVAGKIVGDIASTNIHGTAFKADTIVNNNSTTLDITAAGFLNIFGGADDAGVSNIQMDKNGINHIELKTEPGNPGNPTDYARVAINAGTNEGDVRIGTPVSTRNQVVEMYNATVYGTLVGEVLGTIVGDVQGSVVADDSSVIIDGVAGKVVGPISKIVGDVQQISGAGAISLDTLVTEITTTGADAYTLADGVVGQIKIIAMIVDGGDATLTPTTLATGTTITFSDVNDNITLLYTTNGWLNTANQNATIA